VVKSLALADVSSCFSALVIAGSGSGVSEGSPFSFWVAVEVSLAIGGFSEIGGSGWCNVAAVSSVSVGVSFVVIAGFQPLPSVLPGGTPILHVMVLEVFALVGVVVSWLLVSLLVSLMLLLPSMTLMDMCKLICSSSLLVLLLTFCLSLVVLLSIVVPVVGSLSKVSGGSLCEGASVCSVSVSVDVVAFAGFQLLPLVLPVGIHLPHVMFVEVLAMMVVLSSTWFSVVGMTVGLVALVVSVVVVVVVGVSVQAFPGSSSSSSKSAHLRLALVVWLSWIGVVFVSAVVLFPVVALACLLAPVASASSWLRMVVPLVVL
jgi:hypothetical protein